MKRILLTLLTTYFAISHTNCIPFCDIQSIDNVFNIGHLIYMTRCGEVWTYDPRMDGGAGGFLRDYSVYTFARRQFAPNIITAFGEYKKEYLRFAAFSFQEVNCLKNEEDLKKSCAKSVVKWNAFSIIIDNTTGVTFQYNSEFLYSDQGFDNPLGLKATQKMSFESSPPPNNFWPDIRLVAKQFEKTPQVLNTIHSALFVNDENRLFVALRPDDKYYCITYLDMDLMLHNISEWPDAPGTKYARKDWANAFCFTGHLVGMYYDIRAKLVKVVGRILYESRVWEDQVYIMTAGGGQQVVTIKDENTVVGFHKEGEEDKRVPLNMRTAFGCKPEMPDENERKKRSVTSRKKRSISEDMRRSVKIDYIWIRRTLLSTIVLFLVYAIVRYSTDAQFRARIVKKD